LRGRGNAPSGALRIGANPSFGNTVFPSLAGTYTARFPAVRLHFVIDMTLHIQEAVKNGRLDCAIVAFPDRDPALVTRRVASESIHLVSHRTTDPGLGPVCTVRQLANVPLLLPGLPHRERLGYERLAAAKGETLRCVMEAESLPILRDLARLGHLLLPSTAVFKLQEDGQWTSARVNGFQVERFVVWHTERPITEAMSGFMKILDGELAGLAKQGILS
jgi:LysR family nitrogen assimilation transcriptional regulator